MWSLHALLTSSSELGAQIILRQLPPSTAMTYILTWLMAVLDIFHHILCDLMTYILICELFDKAVIKCVIIYSNIDLVTFDLYILTCELLDRDTGPGRVVGGQEFTELTHRLRGVERRRVQTLVQQVLTVLPVIQDELNTAYPSLNGTNSV